MKKILLIGDSIRQGYDTYIKMIFEGTALVTEQVRRSIESVLAIKGADLDYEELFSKKHDVLGV